MKSISSRATLAAGLLVLCNPLIYPAAAMSFDKETKLTAPDPATNDRFGYSVSVSGRKALIGALFDDDKGTDSGSAYLFDTTTGNQLMKLTAADGVTIDYFGAAVAISGDTAIVGAFGDDDRGSQSGSAYVFDARTGQQLQKLTAADGTANDIFGISVAISGNIAIISARDDTTRGTSSGSAYLFDTTTGNQLWKLVPSDVAPFDNFGRTVAISGNLAIVGSPGDDDGGSSSGSAYVFDVTTGQQLRKLIATDDSANDQFGYAVAISGNTAVIGAVFENDATGAAYLFNATTGAQLRKIVPEDVSDVDLFGSSVAIDGGKALVGSLLDDDGGNDTGSAYVFDAISGEQIKKLTALDGVAAEQFGYSVAIDGGTALIGAWAHDNGPMDSGAAYVFAPEPSGLSVVMLGFASVGFSIRRKRCWSSTL